MATNWLLWDYKADTHFVRIFFPTEAAALKHRKLVVADLEAKLEMMRGVGTKEIADPMEALAKAKFGAGVQEERKP